MSAQKLERLAVVGALGRMGRAVVEVAEAEGVKVVLAIDAGGPESNLGKLKESGAQVVIDFSAPAALLALCKQCAEAGVGLVSGTTGLDEAGLNALALAAEKVPVLWEPNMSVGVHVLSVLVTKAIELLGGGFDVEIVEAHHGRKVDAPSGTAIRLFEAASRARAEVHQVHGRQGKPGARTKAEVGMHAVRGGDVIGDHTVHLLGRGERLELTHRASGRDLFARGAFRAAQALASRAPGRYSLADVI